MLCWSQGRGEVPGLVIGWLQTQTTTREQITKGMDLGEEKSISFVFKIGLTAKTVTFAFLRLTEADTECKINYQANPTTPQLV